MKILIIYFDIIELKHWKKNFHYGIGALSAYLKSKGHLVYLYYLDRYPEENEIKSVILKINPDLIGFSVTSAQFQYVESIANIIKKYFNIPIICGGIHAILCPEQIINIPAIDIVCTCEGEKPLSNLLECLEQKRDYLNIKGLWFKKENQIIKNDSFNYIENLDEIPFSDRDLFNFNELYETKYEHRAAYIASRGCPYKCSYCANKALQERMKIKKGKIRFHSVDYVIEELKFIKSKYDINSFKFDDDILPLYFEWFEDFIKKYISHIKFPFICNLRFNLVNENVLKLLKEAGCYQIQLGLESGNEYYRKNFLHRDMSQSMIINKMKMINEFGFKIYTYNILGGPEERPEQILDTIKLNASGNTHMVQLSLMNPYPGTYIYEYCKKHNLLVDDFYKRQSYFEDVQIIKNKYLPFNLLIFYKNNFFKLMRFYRNLYHLPKFLSKIAIFISDKIFSNVIIVKIFPILQLLIFYYRNVRNILLGKPLISKEANSIEGIGKNN